MGGRAWFETCRCGALIVDGWDTCRFCGAADDSPPVSIVGVLGPQTTAKDVALSLLQLLGALALAWVLNGVVPDLNFARSEASPAVGASDVAGPLLDQRVDPEVLSAYRGFCSGDRASGVQQSDAFDPSATDRGVFDAQGPPLNSSLSVDELSGTGRLPPVIVCRDVIGEVVDGALCDGGATGVRYQQRIAYFRLTAYAARSAEVLGVVDTGPDDRCPRQVVSAASDRVVMGVAKPDHEAYEAFLALLANRN